MTLYAWIAVGLVAWVALSFLVSVAVGRMVRTADSREPVSPARNPVQLRPSAPASAPTPLRKVS